MTQFMGRLPSGCKRILHPFLEDVKLKILGAMHTLLWSVLSPYAMLKCVYAGMGSINTNY